MKAIIAVPATLALVYRAHLRRSLTPLGILAAALTAVAHAAHPWNLPFVLLIVFFLAGTRATAVKKEVKATLTLSASGGPSSSGSGSGSRGSGGGGEGPRTHVQVLANSLVASVLALLHARQLAQRRRREAFAVPGGDDEEATYCFGWGGDLLVVGIIANYAAVCADTFSSELGILSRSEPRLITSLTLRRVPRGTNGGVTVWGLVAGFLGSLLIVATSLVFLPLCKAGSRAWSMGEIVTFVVGMTVWGTLGSVLDSFLGGWLQRSVRDVRTGKIVEGEGGVRVLASTDAPARDARPKLGGRGAAAAAAEDSAVDDSAPSPDRYDPKNKHRKPSFGDNKPTRVVETGWDVLDNNQVNFLMAFTMSVGGMVAASWYWDVPLSSIWSG